MGLLFHDPSKHTKKKKKGTKKEKFTKSPSPFSMRKKYVELVSKVHLSKVQCRENNLKLTDLYLFHLSKNHTQSGRHSFHSVPRAAGPREGRQCDVGQSTCFTKDWNIIYVSCKNSLLGCWAVTVYNSVFFFFFDFFSSS